MKTLLIFFIISVLSGLGTYIFISVMIKSFDIYFWFYPIKLGYLILATAINILLMIFYKEEYYDKMER